MARNRNVRWAPGRGIDVGNLTCPTSRTCSLWLSEQRDLKASPHARKTRFVQRNQTCWLVQDPRAKIFHLAISENQYFFASSRLVLRRGVSRSSRHARRGGGGR